MAVQIQYRRGTNAEWAAANPVLAVGEPGYETDTGYFKVGNGTSPWNALLYSSGKMGTNAVVSIGTVSITAPGTSPTVTDGDASANSVILNFTLPRVNTVNMNTTTRILSPGSLPTVIDQGSSGNIMLSFGIPLQNGLTVNTTTRILNPGSLPSVIDQGSSGNIILNFGIPLQNGLSLNTTTRVLAPASSPSVIDQGASGNIILNFGFPWANTLNVNNQILVLTPSQLPNIRDTGSAGNAIISFGIPRAVTITTGTTTTTAPGTSATVTNSGTSNDLTLDFGVPRGNVGDKGGYKVTFNASTAAASNPGSANIRFNSGTIGSVSQIYINTQSKFVVAGTPVDYTTYINSWGDSSSTSVKGQLELMSNWDAGYNTATFSINSLTPASSGYATVGVTYLSGRLPNSNEDLVIRYTRTGDKGNTGNMAPKSITMMYPAPTDNVIMFFNPTYARTVARVISLVKGTSPSVTYYLRYNANSDPLNTATRFDILTANVVTNTTFGQANTSFANAVIPADTWVWVYPSAVSGTVQQFHLSMEFAN